MNILAEGERRELETTDPSSKYLQAVNVAGKERSIFFSGPASGKVFIFL